MAETKPTMKLAITSSDEIMQLLQFLNDCECLREDLQNKEPKDIDFSEYKILGKGFFFSKDDYEDLLSSVLHYVDNIHFHRILWNADVLLKNCADLSIDTLDFSPDIKRGLELVELEKNHKITINDTP